MTLVPLTTYLRMFRKRTGFTHEEVAFLCGGMCGSSISRHERGKQLPMLKTALMYEFILQTSVRDLYVGLFHDARASVRERAGGLCASLGRRRKTASRDHKIAVLRALLEEAADIAHAQS